MKGKNIFCILLACAIMCLASPAQASAASKTTIAYSKGCVIKVADGSKGYAVSKKHLKKGVSLTLKKVSNDSKTAKTFAYGTAKGWSDKKLAKALKKPKNYKTKVKNVTVFKAYKGKKLRYIVVKENRSVKPAKLKDSTKKAAPKQTVKPAPKQTASQAPKQADAVAAVKEAALTIRIASSDATYDSPVYALNGTPVIVYDAEEHGYPLRLKGGDSEAAGSATIPEGDYRIMFPRTADELHNGASPYLFPDETVSVQGDTVKDIQLDPVPGQLYVSLSEETAESHPDILVDDTKIEAPCELNLVAGDHEVEVVMEGETVMSENVFVKPGYTDVQL